MIDTSFLQLCRIIIRSSMIGILLYIESYHNDNTNIGDHDSLNLVMIFPEHAFFYESDFLNGGNETEKQNVI